MQFKFFRTSFPKSNVLHVTKKKKQFSSPKTYNQSNIGQLGMWTMGLRHKDKFARCRYFVTPGDGPGLLGMPDI